MLTSCSDANRIDLHRNCEASELQQKLCDDKPRGTITDAKVTLAEAIRELRGQLLEAATGGDGTPVRFVPKLAELELGITFNVEAEAGGGFKLFSLIDLSGKAKRGDESTHKVKLTLEPVGPDGKPILIRDTEREKD